MPLLLIARQKNAGLTMRKNAYTSMQMSKPPKHPRLPDPPVPRMALPKQGAGSFKSGAAPLPVPPPAGTLPPDDNRLWLFVPKAIQKGQDFIQDDTREWFEERDRKVQICRDYVDHPRWVIGPAGSTIRGRMYNNAIVSEVHLLARITAGLPEYPSWVPVKLSLKQQQADVAYRLTKATREVFFEHGKEAMKVFAERAPGQFIKFVGATFIPKKVEAEITQTTETLDPETADHLLAALTEELRRREQDMKVITLSGGGDYEPPVDVAEGVHAAAGEMLLASGPDYKGATPGMQAKGGQVPNLKHVADLLDPAAGEDNEIEEEGDEEHDEWD